ncbi:arabinose isomerase [Dinghuibacter silviterrae]|uniref:L-arabinose isomerase n=1 Tax=Dinghuibacter silviterrae TaxID=1539049 RepID=A0A4R8DHD9_9BACT|nr:arabinose isomerase [Dinghuibacter silviterrae]TDW96370.1 L-arabinose isomerase [Dinghuibacter silviterrae]
MKIGLFGIGLDTYWPQFDGLEARLRAYLGIVEEKLAAVHPDVVNAGLVDTTDKAFAAGRLFRSADVELIFLYATTYALSSTVLPVVQAAKVPVVILNLSPSAAIDYDRFNALQDRTQMTGEWLAYCSSCPVPELMNVCRRVGIRCHQVTGMLERDKECWAEIGEWISAARVAHVMRYNRLGLMGHYYSGMLDVYTDLTQQYASFGGHIELLEVDELSALRKTVTPAAAGDRVRLFREVFDVRPECPPADLEQAAVTSIALAQMVAKYKLGSLAYYYKGSGQPDNELAIASMILGNSWLTANGVPVAGEYEVKNVQAMKILDSFGAGGSFTEYYAIDFDADVVLMGHDGPGHPAIAGSRTIVRPLQVYHGKVSRGLSVEMSVRKGPVTLLSVVEKTGGGLFLLVAEGESVDGPVLQIGNTNSRYRFPPGARNFVQRWNSHGPAHHCAVGVGHLWSKLEKFAILIGMDIIKVC